MLETGKPTRHDTADLVAERAATLSLVEQRALVLQLAPRVLAGLPDEERDDFLEELQENLTLGHATSEVAGGPDSNPGAWEMPSGE